jgi:hypothetical protein
LAYSSAEGQQTHAHTPSMVTSNDSMVAGQVEHVVPQLPTTTSGRLRRSMVALTRPLHLSIGKDEVAKLRRGLHHCVIALRLLEAWRGERSSVFFIYFPLAFNDGRKQSRFRPLAR